MKYYIDETTRKVLKKFPHRAADVADSCDHNKINAKSRFVSRIRFLQQSKKNYTPNAYIAMLNLFRKNLESINKGKGKKDDKKK